MRRRPFVAMVKLYALCLLALIAAACGDDRPRTVERDTSRAEVRKAPSRTPVYRFEVVNAWPHDTGAFTQGLLFHDGALYESTGLEGKSSLRRVAIETGAVEKQIDLPADVFAEGLALHGDRLYQLSWRNHVGFVYDLRTFELKRRFEFYSEGWGLTSDGRRLYMSDGTNVLRVLDPDSLRVERTIPVFDGDVPVSQLNELEWIDGEIWANVWKSDRVVRIDPQSGRVTAFVDLKGLLPPQDERPGIDVLNGIAWDRGTNRIWVTGKLWPRLFEIRVVPAAPAS